MAVVRLPVGAKYIHLHKTSRSAQRPAQTPIQLAPVLSPWINPSIRDADIHLHLLLSLRMHAATPRIPHTTSSLVCTVTTCNFNFGVALDTEI